MCAQIPEELSDDHPIRKIPVTPFGPSTGITFLGVPVDFPGSSVQAQGKWEKAVAGTLEMLDRLRLLPDGQLRHCLLRHCLDACRVQHLMRSTPRAGAAEFSRQAQRCTACGRGRPRGMWPNRRGMGPSNPANLPRRPRHTGPCHMLAGSSPCSPCGSPIAGALPCRHTIKRAPDHGPRPT